MIAGTARGEILVCYCAGSLDSACYNISWQLYGIGRMRGFDVGDGICDCSSSNTKKFQINQIHPHKL